MLSLIILLAMLFKTNYQRTRRLIIKRGEWGPAEHRDISHWVLTVVGSLCGLIICLQVFEYLGFHTYVRSSQS